MAVLELKNISKSFGKTEVLKNIDLVAEKGEFITLLGSSGCGKTTTLRIISGLESPDSGSVFLDGRDVTSLEPNKRDVNTVFQNYALFPHMNVAANVGYSLKIRHVPKADAAKQVKEALELVQLSEYADRMPSELSGGQRQRVAIARSLVARPKVLLLDEPLGALDLQLRRRMQLELKRLQKKLGITFIYITHDQEEAINMSDRIAVMRGGVFEQIGTPSEVYDRPATAYVAKFVGSANIIRGKAELKGDMVRLCSEDGSCLVPRRDFELKEGENVSAAVRSEQISLSGRELKADALHGTVNEKSFAGGMLRISVITPSGKEIIASRHGIDSELKPGDSVNICFEPENAVLVRGGNEGESL